MGIKRTAISSKMFKNVEQFSRYLYAIPADWELKSVVVDEFIRGAILTFSHDSFTTPEGSLDSMSGTVDINADGKIVIEDSMDKTTFVSRFNP